MKSSKLTVYLNLPRVLKKVENDQFGLFLAKEWKRLINPYTPHRNGQLEQNVRYAPFSITYNEPYSHYMYYGVVYIDPVYGIGGFTNDGGTTFWSRPGIRKIPSARGFEFRKDPNQYATDHWDQAAAEAGQKDKLIVAANKYLRRLG